jgi:hypothetical protein
MPSWLPYVLGGKVAFAVGYLSFIAAKRNTDLARIAALENRIDVVGKKVGHRDDYVHVLRNHIDTGQPPPSPRYPLDIGNGTR